MPPLTPASAMRRFLAGLVVVAAGLSPLAIPADAVAATRHAVIDGPDVASYQHPGGARINWHRVARSHKEFAIVKATEGTSYRNPWFHSDYVRSRRAGLVRGSYHFARPGSPIVTTARRQAHFYVARLGRVRTYRT